MDLLTKNVDSNKLCYIENQATLPPAIPAAVDPRLDPLDHANVNVTLTDGDTSSRSKAFVSPWPSRCGQEDVGRYLSS